MKRLRQYDDTKPPPLAKRQRPADAIHVEANLPKLPKDCLILLRMSPLDLIDGEARSTYVWNPERCIPRLREEVRRILSGSMRTIEISAADEAALEFFSRGPRGVQHWDNLDQRFQYATRSELGLINIAYVPVRTLCVDDDDSSDSDESSENAESDEEDSENESEDSTIQPKITDFLVKNKLV